MPPELIRALGPTPDTLLCDLSNRIPLVQQMLALKFCYSASREDPDSIGWMPRAAYDNRHARGEILVLFNNLDLVGFVMMSRPSPYQELRCLQIWVRPDARMIVHGRRLIDTLDQVALARRCITTRLWCAEDLAANLFWEALGYKKKGWRWGPAKKPRRHLLWTRPVQISQPSLLLRPGSQLETA